MNRSEEATRIAKKFCDEYQIPGIALLAIRDGEEAFEYLSGMADVENGVPISRQTYFRFASVSKPITATLAMKLVESKRIELDDPLDSYWRQAPATMTEMTLRQLLCHQSGLRHYQPTAWTEPLRHYKTLQDRINRSQHDPILFPPGSRFAYSTFGYVVAGRAMEVATGDSFTELLTEYVYRPAGMKSVRSDDLYELIPNRARGYFIGIDNKLRNSVPFDATGKLPGGGLGGRITDLAAFCRAIMDGNLLSKRSCQAMWTPQRLSDGRMTDYGLGWHLTDRPARECVYHTGSQPGVSSAIVMIPDQRLCVVCLCNLEQVNLIPLAKAIIDRLR